MNYPLSCLLLACILLSGCAVGTGSCMNTSATSGSARSQAYTCSAPRNSVRVDHHPQARQTPVTHFKHVAFMSPRMQGFYRANPAFERRGPAANAKTKQPGSPEEAAGRDKTIVAQPAGSRAFRQISNQHVAAASLFPVVEPHYAGLIAIVTVFVSLIYFALYKFADFVRQAAGTIPLEGSDEFPGDYQPPSRDSSTGSGPEDVPTSGGIRMGQEGTDCSDRRKKILLGMQSGIKRTFKRN